MLLDIHLQKFLHTEPIKLLSLIFHYLTYSLNLWDLMIMTGIIILMMISYFLLNLTILRLELKTTMKNPIA